jgi:hypothetical protein
VQLTSCDDDHRDDCLQSQLTVHTTVEAIISCKNTITWVEGGTQSARTGTPMRVRLLAFDVDNLPIAHTRVPLEFRFKSSCCRCVGMALAVAAPTAPTRMLRTCRQI